MRGVDRRPFLFAPYPVSVNAYDNRLLRRGGAVPTLIADSQREEENMKNPLESLWGTVITGLVLTVILYYLAKSLVGG